MSKGDRVSVLELEIEEQRRDYDVFYNLYEQAKVKNFTFLAAALGLLGFMYGTTENGASLAKRLFIPHEAYGIILYAIGAIMFLTSTGLLLYALKPLSWYTAYDNEQEDHGDKNYVEYLTYMKKCYLKASRVNMGSYEKKTKLLNISLILLLGGTILLLLIKKFGDRNAQTKRIQAVEAFAALLKPHLRCDCK